MNLPESWNLLNDGDHSREHNNCSPAPPFSFISYELWMSQPHLTSYWFSHRAHSSTQYRTKIGTLACRWTTSTIVPWQRRQRLCHWTLCPSGWFTHRLEARPSSSGCPRRRQQTQPVQTTTAGTICLCWCTHFSSRDLYSFCVNLYTTKLRIQIFTTTFKHFENHVVVSSFNLHSTKFFVILQNQQKMLMLMLIVNFAPAVCATNSIIDFQCVGKKTNVIDNNTILADM